MNKKGFTLIELLVVIAIIGILSSVVLAALNTARGKGSDVSIKANLANTRAQAEIVYDSRTVNQLTYRDVCVNGMVTGETAPGVQGIGGAVQAASTVSGTGSIVINGVVQTALTANCNSTDLAWAASVKLKTSGRYQCVDSTGASKDVATALPAAATICPTT